MLHHFMLAHGHSVHIMFNGAKQLYIETQDFKGESAKLSRRGGEGPECFGAWRPTMSGKTKAGFDLMWTHELTHAVTRLLKLASHVM